MRRTSSNFLVNQSCGERVDTAQNIQVVEEFNKEIPLSDTPRSWMKGKPNGVGNVANVRERDRLLEDYV